MCEGDALGGLGWWQILLAYAGGRNGLESWRGGGSQASSRRETESQMGNGHSYEKTRRSGVTGVPEAQEITFAARIQPLQTLGTGLVGQQTLERPLCALAYVRGDPGSLTLPLSPDTVQLLSPLKRSRQMQV